MSKAKKQKKKSNAAYYVIIVILILFIAAVVVYGKFGFSREKADLNDYFSLTAEDQAGVVIDNAVIGGEGLVVGGAPFVEAKTVSDYISSRFYVDLNEKVLSYALPEGLIRIKPDESTYKDGKEEVKCDSPIWFIRDDKAYIALDFLEKYSAIATHFADDPYRITITTKFGDVQTTSVKKDTQIRKLAGVKSPILAQLKTGTKLSYIDTVDDWYHVRTEDGFIGYVPVKYLTELKSEKTEASFKEPEYSHTLSSKKICLAFDNVTNKVANKHMKARLSKSKGVNVIAPTWFTVANTSGTIESIASKDYVKAAHKAGMQVWATVRDFDSEDGIGSNDETYELLSRTSVRDRMVTTLIKKAQLLNLDGINVDFEKISDECGTSYVEFIRELSIGCRNNDIVLSVDNYVPKVYNSHYGRKEQGLFADYIVIMGYDEHTYGSEEAGSVASYEFVEDGIDQTIEEVSSDRVINALPFYTRIWEEDGDKLSFKSYDMAGAAAAVKKAGAKASWDEETKQNYAEWKADGKTYKVWLEDAKSIKAKLELMNEYELAGVGVWRLGQETSDVWKHINNYLK